MVKIYNVWFRAQYIQFQVSGGHQQLEHVQILILENENGDNDPWGSGGWENERARERIKK